jgi:hypothetical protein
MFIPPLNMKLSSTSETVIYYNERILSMQFLLLDFFTLSLT